MQLFECSHCGQLLFFENTLCEQCGYGLGYIPSEGRLATLEPAGNDHWASAPEQERLWRYCANYTQIGCNWLLTSETDCGFCIACSLNDVIPDLGKAGNLRRWEELERAKRRLVYSIIRLGLPLANRQQDPEQGLAFRFLEDAPPEAGGGPLLTGHANGVITINISEADDASREQRGNTLAEAYRTLLGHFRHEIGHYYWDRLIADSHRLEAFRGVFGDERADYAAALEQHHAGGGDIHWQTRFVSSYASSHPWEDWAETWAYYLHMVDALETARAYGLSLRPGPAPGQPTAEILTDPYTVTDFDTLATAWFPLTVAINSLNRSMGHRDFYSFVLPPPTLSKLAFVHDVIRESASTGETPAGWPV